MATNMILNKSDIKLLYNFLIFRFVIRTSEKHFQFRNSFVSNFASRRPKLCDGVMRSSNLCVPWVKQDETH